MVYWDSRNGRAVEVNMDPVDIIAMDHGARVEDVALLTEEEQRDVASRIVARRLDRAERRDAAARR